LNNSTAENVEFLSVSQKRHPAKAYKWNYFSFLMQIWTNMAVFSAKNELFFN